MTARLERTIIINRDYNSVTGSYIQSDPIGFDGGLNTYLYANGNVILVYDATGECLWCYGAVVVYKIVQRASRMLKNAGFDTQFERHSAHHKFEGCYKEHYQLRGVNHKTKVYVQFQIAFGDCVRRDTGSKVIYIRLRNNASI